MTDETDEPKQKVKWWHYLLGLFILWMIFGNTILGMFGVKPPPKKHTQAEEQQYKPKSKVLMRICSDGTKIFVNEKTGEEWASTGWFTWYPVYGEEVCGTGRGR